LKLQHNEKIIDDGIKNLPLISLDLAFNKKITDEGIKNYG